MSAVDQNQRPIRVGEVAGRVSESGDRLSSARISRSTTKSESSTMQAHTTAAEPEPNADLSSRRAVGSTVLAGPAGDTAQQRRTRAVQALVHAFRDVRSRRWAPLRRAGLLVDQAGSPLDAREACFCICTGARDTNHGRRAKIRPVQPRRAGQGNGPDLCLPRADHRLRTDSAAVGHYGRNPAVR